MVEWVLLTEVVSTTSCLFITTSCHILGGKYTEGTIDINVQLSEVSIEYSLQTPEDLQTYEQTLEVTALFIKMK